MAFENPLKNLGKIGKAQPQQPMQSVEQPPMTPMQPQIQSPMTPMQPQIQSPMTPASVGGFNIQREIEDIRNKYTGMTPQQIVPQQQANIPGVDTSIGGIAGVNTPTISPTLQKPEFQKAYAPEFQKQMQGRDTMFGYLPGGISETKKAVIDFQTQGMDQGQRQEFMNQQSPLRPGGETEIKPDVAPVIQDTIKQALETMPEFEGQQITPQVINMVMQNPEIKNLFLQEMPEAFQNATPTFEGTLDRFQQQSSKFEAPVVGPLVRGASNLLVGTVKAVYEGIGGIKNIAMKIGGQDTGTTLSEDVFDTVEGGTTALFNVFAPYLALGANVAAQTGPGERALNGLSSLMTTGGEYINKIPGLRQFKDSLPEEDQQRFDTFVGSSIVALLGGTKGKTELLKKRSTAELKNFIKTNANPVNIIKNFQENVLNVPVNKTITLGKNIKDTNMTEATANYFTKTATPQDKLFKAQAPTLNVLNKNRDFDTLRGQSDRANQLIVDQGFVPTDTSTRVDMHQKTMENIWKQIEDKVQNKKDFLVDQNQFADIIDNIVKDTKKSGIVKNEPDIKALEKEAAAMRKNPIIDLPSLEKKKQFINGIINNRGDSKIGDVYKNGMKQVTKAIGDVEDAKLSELPKEFSNLKKDFGSLKSTYEDVLKADLKNQKAKGMDIIQSYSRIEGIGDIIGGTLSVFTKGGQGLIDVGKGFGKVFLGKALKKATDPDFLVEQGFKDLSKNNKNVIPSNNNVVKSIIPTLPRKGALNTQQALPSPSTVTPSNLGTPDNPIVSKPLLRSKNIIENTPASIKIRKNANQKVSSETPKPLIKKQKTAQSSALSDGPPEMKKLYEEARKYKSADKFVKDVKELPTSFLRDESNLSKSVEKGVYNLNRTRNNLTSYGEYSPQGTFDKFVEDIKKNGIKEPIKIDIGKDGKIIIGDGTHRLLVAEELGIKNVPVEIRNIKSKSNILKQIREEANRQHYNIDQFEARDMYDKMVNERIKKPLLRKNANQKVSPETPKPLIKKKNTVQSSTLSTKTDMTPLHEEARKYKSADEFIDNAVKNTDETKGKFLTDDFIGAENKEFSSSMRTEGAKETSKKFKNNEPVEITINQYGEINHGDGHHRAYNGFILGEKIPVKIVKSRLKGEELKKYILLRNAGYKKIRNSTYPGSFSDALESKFKEYSTQLRKIREEANK